MPNRPSIKQQRFIRWLLIALTLTAYARTVTYDLITFDDNDYVLGNDMVRTGLTTGNVIAAFTSDYADNWHPITWISFMLDAEIHRRLAPVMRHLFSQERLGLFPGALHLTNVVIHACNVWLLLSVLYLMTGLFWRSALVAALFALHPIHVESVAWVTERKDVLSMFFMLLTIRAYVYYTRDRDWAAYAKVALYFALGLMSKPMLVTLPCALLLLDIWPLRRLFRPTGDPAHLLTLSQLGAIRWKVVLEKLPLLALSAGSAAVTMGVQVYSENIAEGVWMSLPVRLANVVVSYVRYLGNLFWPLDLGILYPNPAQLGRPFWSPTQVIGAAALLVIVTVAAFIWSRRRGYPIVGWLWFLGTFTPVIGFVQIGRHSMADRYAYIPFIGLYIIMAWGAGEIAARRPSLNRIVIGLCAAMIFACAILSIRQVSFWRSSEALYLHTLAVTEDNWVVHSMVGMVYTAKGMVGAQSQRPEVAQEEYRKAAQHHEAAVRIAPEVVWERDLLADVYDMQGRHADAQAQWEDALRMAPDRAKSHWGLALILVKRGRLDDALDHARQGVELEPDSAEANLYYGMVLSETDRLDEAITYIERGLDMDEDLKSRHSPTLESIKAARDAAQIPAP